MWMNSGFFTVVSIKAMMLAMKRYVNPRGTLLFVAVAVTLMLIMYFVTNGAIFVRAPKDTNLSQNMPPEHFKTTMQFQERDIEKIYMRPEVDESEFEEIIAAYSYPEPGKRVHKPSKPKIVKKAPEYEPILATGKPKIAIIIDDMGVDRKHSFAAIELDAPLTLAFLPYAPDLEGITGAAKDNEHELMIHMPMQAMTSPVSLGPIALKDGMDESQVKENMKAAFESFEGYVGVNNHMGSMVTQNPEIMDWVMESLKGRGLYFIDSKTIGSSVGAETARLNGLPTAVRDVFLDHEDTPEFVRQALRKTEEAAVRKGHAIAIGHPKEVTINGLKAWIPDVQARGFEIVYASALVERPKIKVASKTRQNAHKVLAKTEPAAGSKSKDPNSAEARAEILKKLFGQSD